MDNDENEEMKDISHKWKWQERRYRQNKILKYRLLIKIIKGNHKQSKTEDLGPNICTRENHKTTNHCAGETDRIQ